MSRIANDTAKVSLPESWTNVINKPELDEVENRLQENITNGDTTLQNNLDTVESTLKESITTVDTNAKKSITAEKKRAEKKETELENKFNSYTPTIDVPGIKVDNATHADNADNATNDANGKNIDTTYAKIENTYNKEEVDQKVSSVYTYKGSVATKAELPTQDLTIGDVYDVKDSGINYAWNGTSWDALGMEIDLNLYAKKTDVPGIKVNNAADSEKLGGSVASDYAKKTDVPNIKVNNAGTADKVINDAKYSDGIPISQEIGFDANDEGEDKKWYRVVMSSNVLVGILKITNGYNYARPKSITLCINGGHEHAGILTRDTQINQLGCTGELFACTKVRYGYEVQSKKYFIDIFISRRNTYFIQYNGVGKVIIPKEAILAQEDTYFEKDIIPDAMTFNGKKLATTEDITATTPVATIIYSAAKTAPDGFLLCDGREITAQQYPRLYAAIGTDFDPNHAKCLLPNQLTQDGKPRALYGADSSAYKVGTYIEESLPNIKGKGSWNIMGDPNTNGYFEGCINPIKTKEHIKWTSGTDYFNDYGIGIDASKNYLVDGTFTNTVYQDNANVFTNGITVNMYIKY